mgnify:FL=1
MRRPLVRLVALLGSVSCSSGADYPLGGEGAASVPAGDVEGAEDVAAEPWTGAPTVETIDVGPPTKPTVGLHATGHYRVRPTSEVEDFTVTPDVVAFVDWQGLWRVDLTAEEVEFVASGVDLHFPRSDDEYLYWLGREGNGKLHYRSEAVSALSRFASRGMQLSFAVGDVPYGLLRDGTVRRIGPRQMSMIMGPRPGWLASRLLAGDGVVVFTVRDQETSGSFHWRLRGRRNGQRLEIPMLRPGWEALHSDGRFVVAYAGVVSVVRPKSSTLRRIFDAPNLAELCWCGDDVCVLSKTAELQRHHGTKESYDTLAVGAEEGNAISCNGEFVAWSSEGAHGRVIELISLATLPRG